MARRSIGARVKDTLADLERIRKGALCAYSSAGRYSHCDCKFLKPGNPVRPMSENGSGCPELYAAMDLIRTLAGDNRALRRKLREAKRQA